MRHNALPGPCVCKKKIASASYVAESYRNGLAVASHEKTKRSRAEIIKVRLHEHGTQRTWLAQICTLLVGFGGGLGSHVRVP
ncbi:hypothetical protein SH449x_001675 [Pirellulaceae bacterium SH449]